MKKLSCLALALCLLLVPMLGAGAEGMADARYLFCYIIGIEGNVIDVMDDTNTEFYFTLDNSTNILSERDLSVDDAVVLMYVGELNYNAALQSVKVAEVSVLRVMYGIIEDFDDTSVTVNNDDDDALYRFDTDGANIVTGEEDMRKGDQIEIAYKGQLANLGPNEPQQMEYIHVTDLGQAASEDE